MKENSSMINKNNSTNINKTSKVLSYTKNTLVALAVAWVLNTDRDAFWESSFSDEINIKPVVITKKYNRKTFDAALDHCANIKWREDCWIEYEKLDDVYKNIVRKYFNLSVANNKELSPIIYTLSDLIDFFTQLNLIIISIKDLEIRWIATFAERIEEKRLFSIWKRIDSSLYYTWSNFQKIGAQIDKLYYEISDIVKKEKDRWIDRSWSVYRATSYHSMMAKDIVKQMIEKF